MFYRIFVLADFGPRSQFHDPVYQSPVFESVSLTGVYHFVAHTFMRLISLQDSPVGLTPARVYLVYGNDPDVCPYRSTNKRIILFAFNKRGIEYRTFGCEHL